ncbi:nicotinate-nucleotide--dimethylbenzimidazole phosphoribosyltransferase [Primorskyibacter sp. S187A]|uniref:nicotinate-nucleotide--dimethylbenzimidazole phosphoribosyltransferase n=1 Tax=Primorskyibacter sp. S187A TaxID=3415130 RepID=UPI003C7A2829
MSTTAPTQNDTDFAAALQAKIDTKTKPLGALGRIEEIAAQIARVQGNLNPRMETCQLVIFAADHGLAREGVSAFPAEVTRQMVLNFAGGGAAANVFTRSTGMDLQVVNAGVMGGAFDMPGVVDAPMGEGTASALTEPAMSAETCKSALARGRDFGVAGAYDAMAFGEMGIGNTSAATLIAHRLLDLPVGDLVGRGTGVDDAGLAHKQDVLERASARVPGPLTAERALEEFGGFEIAMIAGAMMGAAEAKRIVLVDGFIASAAALIAARIAPQTRKAMVFAHHSAEAGHAAILAGLDAQPLLHLGLRLGEGTGGALAWPLVKSAAAMLNEMASFADAGVSEKE